MKQLLTDDFAPVIGHAPAPRLVSSEVLRGGSTLGFAFRLDWGNSEGGDGCLAIEMEGHEVWSIRVRSPNWPRWAALVSGMAKAWDYLQVEQSYPLGVTPRSPSGLADALYRRTGSAERADKLHAAFRAHHDLAHWIGGGSRTPPLWLVREGNMMLVETGGQTLSWHLNDVMRSLRLLGDGILAEGRAVGASILPSNEWQKRGQEEDAVLASIGLGLPPLKIVALRNLGVPIASQRYDLLCGLDEVSAATRMLANRVPDTEVALVAEAITGQAHIETSVLDGLGHEALKVLSEYTHAAPHVQGREIARWFRSRQGLDANAKFDPDSMLAEWGVEVQSLNLSHGIEAVSFWGTRHGPSIILNSAGESPSQSRSGRDRATLAHEICHLLVDRTTSLPVAEVMGGSVPELPEMRARAFAAEVLLPQEAAGAGYRSAASVRAALGALVTAFGVSRTVAAYQTLKHFGFGSSGLRIEDLAYLERVTAQQGLGRRHSRSLAVE